MDMSRPYVPSWPGKSAKRVFALAAPPSNDFLESDSQDVDARDEPGHDGHV